MLQDKEKSIQEALDCPCVAPLRESSCGGNFDQALTCFMKSPDEQRGTACVGQFIDLHECMIKHPKEFEEFAKELVANEEKEGFATKR